MAADPDAPAEVIAGRIDFLEYYVEQSPERIRIIEVEIQDCQDQIRDFKDEIRSVRKLWGEAVAELEALRKRYDVTSSPRAESRREAASADSGEPGHHLDERDAVQDHGD